MFTTNGFEAGLEFVIKHFGYELVMVFTYYQHVFPNQLSQGQPLSFFVIYVSTLFSSGKRVSCNDTSSQRSIVVGYLL
jgi:hypothetical protein